MNMDYNQMAALLTSSFTNIVVASAIVVFGFLILAGLALLYVWLAKWTCIIIKKQYVDALSSVWNGKKVKA